MDFLTWKDNLIASVEEIGLRPTARKFNLAVSSLQNILKGDEYSGLTTWKRVGAHLKVAKPESGK